YVVAMCRLSEAELYCVNTNIRITSELMQFEMGTSTRRYFPPSGTAGFERSRVKGNRRLPAPPPRMTASKLRFGGMISAEDIGKRRRDSRWLGSASLLREITRAVTQRQTFFRELGTRDLDRHRAERAIAFLVRG